MAVKNGENEPLKAAEEARPSGRSKPSAAAPDKPPPGGDDGPHVSCLSVTSVAAYLICSCVMLLINKGAILSLGGFSVHLLALQLAASSIIVFGAAAIGVLKEKISDMVSLKAMAPWVLFSLIWVVNLAFNMKALQRLNPDMLILFRAATTGLVAIGDFLWFAHRFTWSELVGIAGISLGCATFALDNLHADREGIIWATLFCLSMTLNTLYAKGVFNAHVGVSAWMKTYYLNTISFLPCCAIAALLESPRGFADAVLSLSPSGALTVFLSCVMGLLIGATGNTCRHMLSATGFDIAGNVNKFATIFLSQIAFDYVLTARSTFGALLAITGATIYSNTVGKALTDACTNCCGPLVG